FWPLQRFHADSETIAVLDFWPLQRFHADSETIAVLEEKRKKIISLLLEKTAFIIPLLAVIPVAVFFMLAGHDSPIINLTDLLPGKYQIGNSLTAYFVYLQRIFWPFPQVFPYPYRAMVPDWQLYGSLLLHFAILVLLYRKRRSQPFLLFGWCWFMIILLPMIGLLKIGPQAIADRYAYIPMIGIIIILVWGADHWGKRLINKKGLSILGVTAVIPLLFVSHSLVGLWKNSETLFRHSVSVSPNNPYAYAGLGYTLKHKGRYAEAITQYQQALIHKPDFAKVHNNLAYLLMQEGKLQEATSHYRTTVQLTPQSLAAHVNLANTLVMINNREEAVVHYQKALELNPGNSQVQMDIGVIYMQLNKLDLAVEHFQQALTLQPDMEKAMYNLGVVKFQQGKVDEAIQALNKATQVNPNFFEAHYNLGIILTRQMKLPEAAQHLEEAIRLQPEFEEARHQLVLIYKHMANWKRAEHHVKVLRQLKGNP
ncbi:MAG: tetratricopeptide repeat protein, partial [Candidatus Electrothrix sp.]